MLRPAKSILTWEALEAEEARRAAARAADLDRHLVSEHRDEILERCKTLSGFVKEAWHVVEPSTVLKWGWAMDAITDHIAAALRGDITRLLVNCPPGMAKSLLVCVFAQAYEWGPLGKRSKSYFSASWNGEFSTRDSRKTRDLIQSTWFQELWPEVSLTRTAEDDFANTDFGFRKARPFDGLTSGRADRLVWDDPHSTEEAESDKDRARATRVFRESVPLRINDPILSIIIGIMQRLHANDVSGVIDQLGLDYVKLILPMEFETARRCYTVVRPLDFTGPPFKARCDIEQQHWYLDGEPVPVARQPYVEQAKAEMVFNQDRRTHEGELLFPERFTRETVERDKIPLGAYGTAGQFQQRPAPREGGNFKREWFEIVGAAPAQGNLVRAWDLASTKGGGDWTAGVLMLRTLPGVYYIVDVVRFRGSPREVDAAIRNTAAQDAATYGKERYRVRLPKDPGQAGTSQKVQHASLLDGYTFRILPVTGEKTVRAAPLSSQAEAGNVKLVRGAWNAAFLEEIGMFPNGSFDDQVDAAADAYTELLTMATSNVPLLGPMIMTAPRPGV